MWTTKMQTRMNFNALTKIPVAFVSAGIFNISSVID